nr:MFS transporter [Leifsonia psychrotolerans]
MVAANLRTAVTALSPIVTQISADVPLGALALGILGMLPPVCFAVFGIMTPVFVRRASLESVLIVALVAITVGDLARGFSGSVGWLIASSAVAFAGMGAGNVLLPPLVKKYFPDRVGLVTALYATMLAFSTLIPPLIAVPVADSAGWRISLGLWFVLGILALLPWLSLLVRHRSGRRPTPVIEEADPAILNRIWGSSIAWALAVLFAASSLNAYAMFAWLPQLLMQVAGSSAGEAGNLLSVYAAVGVPASIIIPILAVRLRSVAPLIYLATLSFVIGYLGLLLVPTTATWLWSALAGLGTSLFPLALVLINLRTRTHAGSVALSGFVQSIGYTLGAVGPLLFGIFHEQTGGWDLGLYFLLGTAVVALVAGIVVARPHLLEDDLARRGPATS